jgi:cysteinyl-tRNA synthetase
MTRQVLYLHNTLTREKEAVVPQNNHSHITMYTCGPTVYDFCHIGNLRTFIFEDLLRRTLEYFGFQVRQVMNITDVDDKTIEGAIKENVNLADFTEKYIDGFFSDLQALKIQRADHYPRATEYISQMIEMIESLLEKGFAYEGKDGNIFFSIKAFPSYGKLSHLDLSTLKIGASERVTEGDEYEKEELSDFVLWKKYKESRDGHVFWESPFGKGRPGWHIECSAMATALLGKTIDLHCGGIDNIFPHHDNEIAQCEGTTGQTFARIWAHSAHLLVDGKKMSKSLGNFYKLFDLTERGYDLADIRYMLMQTHYRMQLNFTFQELEAVHASRERIRDFITRLNHLPAKKGSYPIDALLEKREQAFTAALADDLNISAALGELFQLIKEVHLLCDEGKLGKKEAEATLFLLKDWDYVLGFLPFDEEEIPKEIQELAAKRVQARADKNFSEADSIRDAIKSKGYHIEDIPNGFIVKKL